MPKQRTYEELMGIATGKTQGFTGKQRLAAQKMLKTMFGPTAPKGGIVQQAEGGPPVPVGQPYPKGRWGLQPTPPKPRQVSGTRPKALPPGMVGIPSPPRGRRPLKGRPVSATRPIGKGWPKQPLPPSVAPGYPGGPIRGPGARQPSRPAAQRARAGAYNVTARAAEIRRAQENIRRRRR